jgi:hypothetical protein
VFPSNSIRGYRPFSLSDTSGGRAAATDPEAELPLLSGIAIKGSVDARRRKLSSHGFTVRPYLPKETVYEMSCMATVIRSILARLQKPGGSDEFLILNVVLCGTIRNTFPIQIRVRLLLSRKA